MSRLVDTADIHNILMCEKSDYGIFAVEIDNIIEGIISRCPTKTPETVTEFADRCRECGREKVLDKIRADILQLTSIYTISRERGSMGQVEWEDRLIREDDILQIIEKYKKGVRSHESENE